MTWSLFVHSPIVRGAASGIVTAAIVDIGAFRGWQKWSDAVTYNWGLASWRWFQGAILGALTALGWGAAIS
jgi:uncharacterized membrane protein